VLLIRLLDVLLLILIFLKLLKEGLNLEALLVEVAEVDGMVGAVLGGVQLQIDQVRRLHHPILFERRQLRRLDPRIVEEKLQQGPTDQTAQDDVVRECHHTPNEVLGDAATDGREVCGLHHFGRLLLAEVHADEEEDDEEQLESYRRDQHHLLSEVKGLDAGLEEGRVVLVEDLGEVV